MFLWAVSGKVSEKCPEFKHHNNKYNNKNNNDNTSFI